MCMMMWHMCMMMWQTRQRTKRWFPMVSFLEQHTTGLSLLLSLLLSLPMVSFLEQHTTGLGFRVSVSHPSWNNTQLVWGLGFRFPILARTTHNDTQQVSAETLLLYSNAYIHTHTYICTHAFIYCFILMYIYTHVHTYVHIHSYVEAETLRPQP